MKCLFFSLYNPVCYYEGCSDDIQILVHVFTLYLEPIHYIRVRTVKIKLLKFLFTCRKLCVKHRCAYTGFVHFVLQVSVDIDSSLLEVGHQPSSLPVIAHIADTLSLMFLPSVTPTTRQVLSNHQRRLSFER